MRGIEKAGIATVMTVAVALSACEAPPEHQPQSPVGASSSEQAPTSESTIQALGTLSLQSTPEEQPSPAISPIPGPETTSLHPPSATNPRPSVVISKSPIAPTTQEHRQPKPSRPTVAPPNRINGPRSSSKYQTPPTNPKVVEQFLSTRSVDQSKPEEIKRSAQLKQRLIPLLAQAGLEVVPPINVDAQPGAYTSPSQVIVGAADSPQGPPACAVQVGIEYDTNEKEFSGNKDFAAAIPFVFGLKDSLRDGKLYQSVGNGLMHMEGLLAIYGFRFRRDDLSAGATTIRAVYDYVCGQIVPRLHLLKRTEPDTHEANNTATAPRRQLQTNENYI